MRLGHTSSGSPHAFLQAQLDMDSSASPVHGQQEGSAYNGHFESVCYHPLFLFNDHGDLCGGEVAFRYSPLFLAQNLSKFVCFHLHLQEHPHF